jgi:hypothetical protein
MNPQVVSRLGLIRLDEYQNKPLSDAFLTKLSREIQQAGSAGLKLVLRGISKVTQVATTPAVSIVGVLSVAN